jgi:glycosyltransferase involved in cell wall biosynthesis
MTSLPHNLLIYNRDLVEYAKPSRPRDPLTVCMLAYAFYESDTRIMQYAEALAQRGDTVEVVALRRDRSLPEVEVIRGVKVFRIQERTVNETGLLKYIFRILRFFVHSALFLYRRQRVRSYDLVHVHNVPDFLVFAAVAAKLRRVPILLDIHDLLPEFYASKFKISHRSLLFHVLTFIERCSAGFATHVIVANHLWRDRLAARSSSSDKCSVVRNRPDLSIFTGVRSQPPARTDRFLLTYPGSLNWHQGVDIAIRAFASIADQIPDADFHIYGEGSAKPSLILLAQQLGMQDSILFHNVLPSREIARVMAATDLAIEPKRSTSAFGNEALSTKILEFMSLGVPVIASRTTIHAFYYDDSIIQYYDNDDEVALAGQMLRLKNDPALRARIAENASRYVQQNTWDACKQEYLDLVDSFTVASVVRTSS